MKLILRLCLDFFECGVRTMLGHDTHAALAELRTWIKLYEYHNWAVKLCIEEELYIILFQDLKTMGNKD